MDIGEELSETIDVAVGHLLQLRFNDLMNHPERIVHEYDDGGIVRVTFHRLGQAYAEEGDTEYMYGFDIYASNPDAPVSNDSLYAGKIEYWIRYRQDGVAEVDKRKLHLQTPWFKDWLKANVVSQVYKTIEINTILVRQREAVKDASLGVRRGEDRDFTQEELQRFSDELFRAIEYYNRRVFDDAFESDRHGMYGGYGGSGFCLGARIILHLMEVGGEYAARIEIYEGGIGLRRGFEFYSLFRIKNVNGAYEILSRDRVTTLSDPRSSFERWFRKAEQERLPISAGNNWFGWLRY